MSDNGYDGAISGVAVSESDGPEPLPLVEFDVTVSELIALEVDFYDRGYGGIKTLRMSNEGLFGTVGGVRQQKYEPVLYLPIKIGFAIQAEQYGQAMRGSMNRGTAEFAVSDAVLPFLSYSVSGRPWRLYRGVRKITQNTADEIIDFGDPHVSLALVHTGQVEDLSYDPINGRASVILAGNSAILDNALIEDIYDDSYPVATRGRPKPRLWGTGYSLEPVIEDEANLIFALSPISSIDPILEVRVGGVPWDFVGGLPGPGEYTINSGKIIFGGTTLGGEVRADAKTPNWDTYTTANVFSDLVSAGGASVDTTKYNELNVAAPYLIGYYAKDPINRKDALDDIMNGIGGWWCDTPNGDIALGVIAAPSSPAVAAYTEVEIASLQLIKYIPAAWRIRIEFARNWQPASQFDDYVTPGERAAMQADGVVAYAAGDSTVKVIEPHATDILVRSLVLTYVDADAIHTRLLAAWGTDRRIWRAEIWADPQDLMETVSVDFEGVTGLYRVVSATRVYGGGPNEVMLWG